jgi:hypothetical protein
MEARHPEARSGPARCIAARYTAAWSALAAVPDPPGPSQPVRPCPSVHRLVLRPQGSASPERHCARQYRGKNRFRQFGFHNVPQNSCY